MEEMLMKEKESEHQHRRDIVVPTLLPTGVVCLNTLFSNTSVLTHWLSFRANSTFNGSRTPRLV